MKKIDQAARAKRKQVSRTVTRIHTLKKVDEGERCSFTRSIERSIESAEVVAVVQEMTKAFAGSINFYKSEYGGNMSHLEAVEQADSMNRWRRDSIDESQPEKIGWSHISAVAEISMDDGLKLWARVREAADDELASGTRSAKVIGHNNQPYTLAQFLAIRDSFADQWQPDLGIESSMIDMMAIAFSLFLYWSEVAHQRAVEMHDSQCKEVERFESKGWKSPYQSQVDAVDQAHRLAEGYNRQFLRVLRQLRELRRYRPVVIQNNGGQINVGGQQVNMKS